MAQWQLIIRFFIFISHLIQLIIMAEWVFITKVIQFMKKSNFGCVVMSRFLSGMSSTAHKLYCLAPSIFFLID